VFGRVGDTVQGGFFVGHGYRAGRTEDEETCGLVNFPGIIAA
jgi:hypothetical protein